MVLLLHYLLIFYEQEKHLPINLINQYDRNTKGIYKKKLKVNVPLTNGPILRKLETRKNFE